MIRKFKNRVESITLRKALSKNSSISNYKTPPIALFCMPRGGSTWLMEILHEHLQATVIWEPLFRGKYETSGIIPEYTRTGLTELRNFKFWYYEYIEKGDKLPEVERFFKRLFTGKLSDKSILYKNTKSEIQNSKRLLFKFCYANMMLPYLDDKFDLRSIVLHRHPCAVVASQLNHKGGWLNLDSIRTFNIPEVRNKKVYEKYRNILKDINTAEESLAALWALNFIVTQEVQSSNVIQVHYENLLLSPIDTLSQISTHIGENLPIQEILEKSTRPSKTSNSKAPIIPEQQVESWKKKLSSTQVELIVNTIEKFEIDVYNESVMPIRTV